MRAKWKTSSAENETRSSLRPMPTTVVRPPRRVLDQAARMVAARPTHSNAWSAPWPPVSARTALEVRSSESRKSVAPWRRASSSFSGLTSTAMIGPAPAIRAAWSTARPTPPRPSTTTDSPARTRAALWTAP